MNDWFTIEKIDSGTYAISEYKHWEETHCYLLCGDKEALLIDTGLGVSDIKSVTDSLTALPLTVVTTHIHWDHFGGHKHFDKIAVFEKEEKWLSEEFPLPLQKVKDYLTFKPCDFPKNFDINSYQIFKGTPTKLLRNGEIIDLGNRQIKVIHTPGHSPGHCCFYECGRKYLYSGDLIYKGCLDAFYPTTDPLLFMQSVKSLQCLQIDKILPAHHELNIPTKLLKEISDAFTQLYNEGKLKHGGGIFDFGDFTIHI